MRYLVACGIVFVATLSARADAPELIKKLASKDNEVRREAARGLGELGKDAKAAIKPLVKALKDQDSFVRRFAAQALGSIGPDAAKDAIPGLTALLEDDKQPVREAGIKALARMGPSALPSLKKALGGTSEVQEVAIIALGEAGEAGVPALAGVIKNPKIPTNLRRRAIEALPKGKGARVALSALVEVVIKPAATGQEARPFHLDAMTAVGRIATSSDTAAVNALDKIAKDESRANNPLRKTAQAALKAVQARN